MSEPKWYISDYAKNHLRLIPRGQHETGLCDLTLECRQPLTQLSTWDQVTADLAARLRDALPKNPAAQRWLALRVKMEKLQLHQRESELKIEELKARRQRLVLCGLTPEQPAQLAAVDAELRGETHTLSNTGGLLRAVEKEAEQAKTVAARVLHAEIECQRAAALARYTAQRDEVLVRLCALAGPVLDELVAAIDSVKHCCTMGRNGAVLFSKILDQMPLPADASGDAAPAPLAPPAAPSLPQQTAPLPGAASHYTRPADGPSLTLSNPLRRPDNTEPAAPPVEAQPQPEPTPAAREGEDGRGRRRKTAAARAE